MQQNNSNTSNPNIGFFVGGTILTLMFLYGIYTFFEQTAIAAKLLAAGGSILLLVLLIPFWKKAFKINFTN
ncbi:hypothetical protein [Oceanobacillus sp. Castelsardo]|uniref:hypothetical protein n=1 Tax=Oceanobacillus sp. Castelsardo TaxID=1851204 RepID=UPI000838931D|nr:hypothetical protein [Oceanobacillus sp. Castelsardo]